jgi:hypothetical protein
MNTRNCFVLSYQWFPHNAQWRSAALAEIEVFWKKNYSTVVKYGSVSFLCNFLKIILDEIQLLLLYSRLLLLSLISQRPVRSV